MKNALPTWSESLVAGTNTAYSNLITFNNTQWFELFACAFPACKKTIHKHIPCRFHLAYYQNYHKGYTCDIWYSTGQLVILWRAFLCCKEISNSNCFYTLHVLCNGIGHLRSTFVFGTWTNESYNITFLDIRISKIFDAIDIYITREILDVDIAILGISNLGHYTTNAVLCSTQPRRQWIQQQ